MPVTTAVGGEEGGQAGFNHKSFILWQFMMGGPIKSLLTEHFHKNIVDTRILQIVFKYVLRFFLFNSCCDI